MVTEAKKTGHRLKYLPNRKVQADASHGMLGKAHTARLSSKNTYNLTKLAGLISQIKNDSVGLVNRFKTGQVDRMKVALALKKLLKQGHEQAYLLGMRSSGYDGNNIPKEDQQWIQYTRYDEHKFLNPFLDDIVNNRGRVDYATRIQYYADALRGTYNAGRNAYMPSNILVYWRLESAVSPITKKPVEHCSSCVELSRLSPFTPDTLPVVPRAGHTKCLVNCRCKLVYVHSDARTVDAIRAKYRSARALLSNLARRKIIT